MTIRFKILDNQFTLSKSMTGKHQIALGERVLVAEAGSLANQIKSKRNHSFQLNGQEYVVTIVEGLGSPKITATVNGQEQPVELLPPGFSMQVWVLVFVVVPLLAIGFEIFNFTRGPKGGYQIGGLIGMIVGGLIWFAIGMRNLRKNRNRPESAPESGINDFMNQ